MYVSSRVIKYIILRYRNVCLSTAIPHSMKCICVLKRYDVYFRPEVLPHVSCSSMNWIPLLNTEEETLVMAVRFKILYIERKIRIQFQLTNLRNIN